MKLIKLKNSQEVAEFANDWCLNQVLRNNTTSFFIPAGSTPIPLFQIWESQKPEYLNKCDFFQIDEVITGNKTGLFRKFFEQHLPSYTDRINWITDPRDHLAQAAILGLGLNGHIAFHEPGLAESFEFGEVDLTDRTISNLGLEANSKGLTYGIGSFLKCRSLLLIVTGKSKQKVLKNLIVGDETLPANMLRNHKNLTIVYDEDAFNQEY